MGPIVVAVVFGIIVLGGLAAYAIYSGAGSARKERDTALAETVYLENQLRKAKRGLMEIAGGQSGNPVATALTTLDQVEAVDKDAK